MHLVYQLEPFEYKRYRTHLLSLDSESRYTRFCSTISDEIIERFCDQVESNPDKNKIFVIENDDLEVVAAAHIAIADSEVELAFSVLKEYHRQGMGLTLISKCVEWCRNRGIKQVHMACLSSNQPIKRMAEKHGGILTNEGTETFANLNFSDPTFVNYVSEMITFNLAKIDHLRKIQKKFIKIFTFPLTLSL